MERLISLDANTLQSLCDRPETILNEDLPLQIAVATHPDTPRNVLEILANSDTPEIAEAARMHVNYGGELSGNWQDTVDEKLKNRYLGQNDRLAVELLKIAPVPAYFLSEYVPPEYLIQGLNNPYLPLRYRLQLLTRLAQEPSLETRLQVAESPDTPLPVLEQLIGDLELSIRIAVEYNPHCPPELVELVTGQHKVASNWDTDIQQLDNLSNSNWDWIRLAVAQNPSTSEEMLLKLAGDKVFKIQLAVAKNPVTSAAVLAVLAQHSSKEIQAKVAKHPQATEEILHSLFDTQQGVIKSRDNLPASIIERIFNESPKDLQKPLFLLDYGGFLGFFMKQPNTPTWILAEFANIDLEKLRTYAEQEYPKSPIMNQVEGWISDRCGGLIELTKHPQVSTEILEQLANFPNQKVKLAVAQNSKTSETIKLQFLESLSIDSDQRIRTEIAKDSNTPVSILEGMAQSEFYQPKLLKEIRRVLASEYPKNSREYETTADVEMSYLKHEFLYPANISINVENWMEIIETTDVLEVMTESISEEEGYNTLHKVMVKLESRWQELLPELHNNILKKVIDEVIKTLVYINSGIKHNKFGRAIAVALVGNPNTPINLLHKLKNQLVRPYIPLNKRNSDRDVITALAYNTAIPKAERMEYFKQLIASGNYRGSCALEGIARNLDTPEAILLEIMTLPTTGRQAISRNPNAPHNLLEELAQDENRTTRSWVAENPGTPSHVLLKLARDSDNNVRESALKNQNLPLLNRYQILLEQEEQKEIEKSNQILAKRTDSPYALAKVLETGDQNAKISAARNPKTPIQVLERLAKDEDKTIRSVVAENSNLPLATLLQLAEDSDINIRAGFARNRLHKHTPIPILEKLADDESERVRAEVAGNKDTPVEILRKLAQDSSLEVCRRLTRNQNTPVEVLEFLGVEKGIVNVYNANTPENALAAAVEQTLQNKYPKARDKALDGLLKSYTSKMPGYILERLAIYPTSWIRSSVAHHHNTPASALEKMIDDDYSPVLWGISRNPNAIPEIIERLVNRPNLSEQDIEQIYLSIAVRQDIPTSLIEKLLQCNLYGVRESVVSKPNLPLEIAERLIREESSESVLVALARNPILTTELLSQLVRHSNVNVCQTLIHHPNLTLEHWQQLAIHPEAKVREAVATKTNVPTNILETLARDTETNIRLAVAGNINTPTQVLEQLSQDTEATVRTKVAGNPNTSINILERLAKDESVEVRHAIANNYNSPEAIRNLLKDLLPASKNNTQSLSSTLRGLSRIYNPNTDDLPTVLSEYTSSNVALVRFVSLLHPLTPIEILKAGANSVSWIERYAVADNHNTPTEIKQQLTQDSNQIVRAVAIENLTV